VTGSGPALLSGIRVVAFTQFLLGPVATQYLADMGADVIKVEAPGGGAWERSWAGGNTFMNGVSAFFLLSHRNVRSVALDLKSEAGREAVLRLISTADVVVENFRPSVMDRLGLGFEAVRDVKPDIIYASASGYGPDGPSRDLPGQDLLLQAISGLAAATGRDETGPLAAGAPVVDQHAASLLTMGILAALVQKERTGSGQQIQVNMLEAALDLQLEPLTYHLNGGSLQRPALGMGSMFHPAPYGIYEVVGGHVALSLSPLGTLAQALGRPEELEPFRDDQALTRRDEITRVVAALLADQPLSQLLDVLRGAGVWCAPVNDYAGVESDPAVVHLGCIAEFDHPRAGPVRTVRHPIRYSDAEPQVRYLPPEVGEHTADVLEEIGYPPAEVQMLTEVLPASAPKNSRDEGNG
jgi:crotonobetainyl-CoA:carnitine CoA-transferase CaiB-like acyl-CoA transferase